MILLPGPSAFLKIPFIVSPLTIKMLKNRGTPVRLPLCAADHAVLSAKEGENNENSNKESNQFRTFTHPDFIHGEAGPYGKAIIFVMAFSPLGYLRTPGLTITFLTVPVAVGAIILGPTAGAICGAAFGLTSVVMALTGGSAFSAALLQINPFGLLFTCLVPRILEGWICGLIFQLVKKFSKTVHSSWQACPARYKHSVLHEFSVLFFTYGVYPGHRYQAFRRNKSAYFRDSVCRCSGAMNSVRTISGQSAASRALVAAFRQ